MISGYLRLIMETGSESCTGTYAFEADSGAYFEPVQNISRAPIERHIYAQFDGDRLVRWDWHPVQKYRDNPNKDIALVHVVPEGSANEAAWNRVNRCAEELLDFAQHSHRGYRWERVTVSPYVVENTIGAPLGLHFPWNRQEIRDQMEAQHPGKYDEHVYWHGLGGYRSDILGHAYVNSNRAWTYSGQWRTVCHEQGHNFGCLHSTQGVDEYGHPHCMMGRSREGLCGSQLLGLGLFEQDHVIRDPDNNSTHFLAPIEQSPADLRVSECQIITIGSTKLSVRKPRDQHPWGAGDGGSVYLERGSDTYPEYIGRITVGESREVNGLHVRNSAQDGGVIRVVIGQGPSSPFPEALPPVGGESELNRESLSGVWGNPNERRQGIDISVRGTHAAGYWYTYHARGQHGMPPHRLTGREWFELDGRIEDEYIVVDIYQYKGRERKKVGHGTMTLLEGNLRFRFWCENYGRDHLDLARFTSEKLEQGIYETGEYEGYSVSQYKVPETPENPEGLLWIAYHFTHSGIRDITWRILEGVSLEEMTPYVFSGRYKTTYEPDQTVGDPINLKEILDSATIIL